MGEEEEGMVDSIGDKEGKEGGGMKAIARVEGREEEVEKEIK